MQYTETTMEVIKSLAYGMTVAEIAETSGIDAKAVQEIKDTCAEDIAERKAVLMQEGYHE